MRKLLLLFTAVCMAVGMSAETYSGTCGDYLNWSLDTSTGILRITGSGEMKDYSTENYGSYIRAPWYNYRESITSISLPNGLTSIGTHAFIHCNLTSVNIPNSVKTIGAGAFEICHSLASITIPNSVTYIGEHAFYNCISLANITIPNSVTTMGQAFSGTAWYKNQPDGVVYAGNWAYSYKGTMPANTSIVLQNGIIGIVNSAFSGCSGLTSITIPNSVTSIGESAFSGCSGLTSITIPNSVTSIRQYAFYNCSGLTSVTIPNSVTSIGIGAFSGCTSLTSVTIPNSVTSIGGSAFSGCSSLTSVTIGNSVTSIEQNAFYNCTNLKTVINFSNLNIVKGSSNNGYVAYYADNVYDYSANKCGDKLNWVLIDGKLTIVGFGDMYGKGGNWSPWYEYRQTITSVSLPEGLTSIGYAAFSGCSRLTNVTIPNTVTKIETFAFDSCSSLANITIPAAVTKIEDSAFRECTGLTAVHITDLEAWCRIVFTSEEGTYHLGTNPLSHAKVLYLNGQEVLDVVIPTGITTVQPLTFMNGARIRSVVIPEGVSSIGESAFYGCKGLRTATIPSTVTRIGKLAFEFCNNLRTITCFAEMPPICGASAFVYRDEATQLYYQIPATVYVPCNSVPYYQTADEWQDFPRILCIGENTAIESVTTIPADGVRYNILGQQVGQEYKGIVIVNGRKYLAR